ncbi:MAG: DUF4876 domain-containing protein [Muribaculaceae bacterium]|nr:DUF4876 domain-containing protein [Muribaculaceae bacterium]
MKKIAFILASLSLCAGFTSCSDNDNPDENTVTYAVTLNNNFPEDFDSEQAEFVSSSIVFTELNTRNVYTFNSTSANDMAMEIVALPVGIYDYAGEINYTVTIADDTEKAMILRTIGNAVTVAGDCSLSLEWFLSNPSEGFVISEIYAAGSPNAAGTSGLKDTYVKIYNNSSEILYADGLAFCESSLVNSKTNNYEILTPENNINVNFTAGTMWVIPGNGTDVPVKSGEYITLVDQAIDWSEQVPGALNHTGADFEWYDDHALDTDNPSVPNLDKWYSYSKTIWVMSNQCNRSYALVKIPQGMTVEDYLTEYQKPYEYINPITGTHMTNQTSCRIPNIWIIDGINLGNAESYVHGALARSIDASYAKISDKNSDVQRFGKVFVRKTAATTADGRVILQDTDDSAVDFILQSAK